MESVRELPVAWPVEENKIWTGFYFVSRSAWAVFDRGKRGRENRHKQLFRDEIIVWLHLFTPMAQRDSAKQHNWLCYLNMASTPLHKDHFSRSSAWGHFVRFLVGSLDLCCGSCLVYLKRVPFEESLYFVLSFFLNILEIVLLLRYTLVLQWCGWLLLLIKMYYYSTRLLWKWKSGFQWGTFNGPKWFKQEEQNRSPHGEAWFIWEPSVSKAALQNISPYTISFAWWRKLRGNNSYCISSAKLLCETWRKGDIMFCTEKILLGSIFIMDLFFYFFNHSFIKKNVLRKRSWDHFWLALISFLLLIETLDWDSTVLFDKQAIVVEEETS